MYIKWDYQFAKLALVVGQLGVLVALFTLFICFLFMFMLTSIAFIICFSFKLQFVYGQMVDRHNGGSGIITHGTYGL